MNMLVNNFVFSANLDCAIVHSENPEIVHSTKEVEKAGYAKRSHKIETRDKFDSDESEYSLHRAFKTFKSEPKGIRYPKFRF